MNFGSKPKEHYSIIVKFNIGKVLKYLLKRFRDPRKECRSGRENSTELQMCDTTSLKGMGGMVLKLGNKPIKLKEK